MPYRRKRTIRKPRKAFTRRPRFGRRRKMSKYSRKRAQTTGIGNVKYMKVRKEFSIRIVNPAMPNSFNTIIQGGAQTAQPSAWNYVSGNNPSPLTTSAPDSGNGATGISQWLAFYESYYVTGSSVKVQLANYGVNTCNVTLVPTINYSLGTPAAGYDAGGIDAAELPYASKIVLGSVAGQNRGFMKKYVSVKKWMNVKDLEDVTPDYEFAGTGLNNQSRTGPYVPRLVDQTTLGTIFQSLDPTTQAQAGIYWNILFEDYDQFQETPPSPPAMPEIDVRIIQTSYIKFTNRKVLPIA